MRERPSLTDEAILTVLATHYGLPDAGLTFLPLGADSASFVYRVDAADGGVFLLKARGGLGFCVASLAVPRHLADAGIPHIAAPQRTRSGALWVRVAHYALSLTPFIAGRLAADAGMSAAQWRTLGAVVRRVHACALPPAVACDVPVERFVPSRRELIPHFAAQAAAGDSADPVLRALAEIWAEQRARIDVVVAQADALGSRLRAKPAPLVLCHADLHTWNVVLDAAGVPWIIDWDETVRARRERDLMFVIGGIGAGLVSAADSDAFLQGYGDVTIDAVALAYYRYAWAVQDIAAFTETALRADLSSEARRAALDGLLAQFAPGNMVAIATDTAIPAY